MRTASLPLICGSGIFLVGACGFQIPGEAFPAEPRLGMPLAGVPVACWLRCGLTGPVLGCTAQGVTAHRVTGRFTCGCMCASVCEHTGSRIPVNAQNGNAHTTQGPLPGSHQPIALLINTRCFGSRSALLCADRPTTGPLPDLDGIQKTSRRQLSSDTKAIQGGLHESGHRPLRSKGGLSRAQAAFSQNAGSGGAEHTKPRAAFGASMEWRDGMPWQRQGSSAAPKHIHGHGHMTAGPA